MYSSCRLAFCWAGGGVARWAWTSRPEPAELPRIGFERGRVFLGEQPWHTTVPFDLVFFNRTDGAVTVDTVHSSCGCTVLKKDDYAGTVVSPGATLPIRGELSTGLRAGNFTRVLTVLLACGATYRAELNVDVVGTYSFTPATLQFGDIDIGSATDVVRITLFTSETVSLRDAKSDSAWLSAVLRPRGPSQTEIIARADSGLLPHGRNVARLTLSTDDPNRPTFRLVVTAVGGAALRAVPDYVFLSANETAHIRFLLRDGSPAVIAAVEPESDSLDLAIQGDVVRVSVGCAGQVAPTVIWVADSNGNRAKFVVCPAR